MSELQVIECDPRQVALGIVDMQKEGCARHGEGVRRIIKPIQEILKRFRTVGSPIILVQSVRTPDQAEFTVFGNSLRLIEGTPGVEIIPELAPLPHEFIIRKRTHDSFYRTEMEKLLETIGLKPARDAVVVTGIGLNNCVYHAVIGFHIRDYFVLVPEDCVHASRSEGGAFALGQFRSSAYRYNVRILRSESQIRFKAKGEELCKS